MRAFDHFRSFIRSWLSGAAFGALFVFMAGECTPVFPAEQLRGMVAHVLEGEVSADLLSGSEMTNETGRAYAGQCTEEQRTADQLGEVIADQGSPVEARRQAVRPHLTPR